jgi:hypothetical protein
MRPHRSRFLGCHPRIHGRHREEAETKPGRETLDSLRTTGMFWPESISFWNRNISYLVLVISSLFVFSRVSKMEFPFKINSQLSMYFIPRERVHKVPRVKV